MSKKEKCQKSFLYNTMLQHIKNFPVYPVFAFLHLHLIQRSFVHFGLRDIMGYIQAHTHRQRQRRETERQRDRETETERKTFRKTDTETHRETEKQKDRDPVPTHVPGHVIQVIVSKLDDVEALVKSLSDLVLKT